MRFAALLTLLILAPLVVSCGDERDKLNESTADAPSDVGSEQDIRGYLLDIQRVILRAYSAGERLVRIFDKESYVEGLRLNIGRIRQGADDLRQIQAPAGFAEEHAAYADAVASVADAYDDDVRRIDAGEDWIHITVEDDGGLVGQAWIRQGEACHDILAQADRAGVYEVLDCGGDPYFIEASEPAWAHPVFVNTCCGGSDPGSSPLETFYGSDEPFSETLTHYTDEMTKRGFHVVPQGDRYRFEKDGWESCFYLKEYVGLDRFSGAKAEDVAALADYPHAYVATYYAFNICDG